MWAERRGGRRRAGREWREYSTHSLSLYSLLSQAAGKERDDIDKLYARNRNREWQWEGWGWGGRAGPVGQYYSGRLNSLSHYSIYLSLSSFLSLSSDGSADPHLSAEGEEYMRKAEKKLKEFSLFSGDKKTDKACELFERAAAGYKMNENWGEAAAALVRHAELLEKQKNKLEAANKYTEAGMCMARADAVEATKLLEMAISILQSEARLGAAARVWKDLAQLYEDEGQLQDAIEAWRKSADCHESEGTMANCLQCLLHAAELHVKECQYKKASKLYERCGEICQEKQINKGSLRDYFYQALLCQFVVSARKGNLKNMQSMYERFVEMDRKFLGTWQQKLIKNTMDAFADGDVQQFTQHIFDQNSIHPLQDMDTKLFLEIKNILKGDLAGGREAAEEVAQELV